MVITSSINVLTHFATAQRSRGSATLSVASGHTLCLQEMMLLTTPLQTISSPFFAFLSSVVSTVNAWSLISRLFGV